MDEREQVARMLVSMGADARQAEVMAAQLLKRAAQVAEERGVSKIEALAELLELVKAGRQGESYDRTGS